MLLRQLFRGQRVRFAAFDPDKDAETLSRWSHDPDYLRRMNVDPRPSTPAAARKQIAEWLGDMDKREAVHMAVRPLGDERLIGAVALKHIAWPHGTAALTIGVGASADRGQGYGGEAMRLLLAYAFDELSLHRLSVTVGAHNVEGLRFLTRFGFVEEVRMRSALLWNGARWPELMLGLLRSEWGE